MAAFALTTDGRAAVLPSAGYINPDSPPANYVASLVADRRVIVPGDSLKVTGKICCRGFRTVAACAALM